MVENFARLYLRVKSDFTLGFLLFTILLLIKNIVHAFLVLPYVIVENFHAQPIMEYGTLDLVLIPEIVEFIALSIFLYLTRKY